MWSLKQFTGFALCLSKFLTQGVVDWIHWDLCCMDSLVNHLPLSGSNYFDKGRASWQSGLERGRIININPHYLHLRLTVISSNGHPMFLKFHDKEKTFFFFFSHHSIWLQLILLCSFFFQSWTMKNNNFGVGKCRYWKSMKFLLIFMDFHNLQICYKSDFCSKLIQDSYFFKSIIRPVSWGCRIHWLNLCRWVPPQRVCWIWH